MWKKFSFLITFIFGCFFSFNQIWLLSAKAQEVNKQSTEQQCINNLQEEIDNILNQPQRQPENWGIAIEKLNRNQNNQIIYQLNNNKYFIPASNIKLITTATALIELGSNFTIDTPIYMGGSAPNLDSLIIIGKGDPSLKQEQLKQVVENLKNEGVKSVNQVIFVEDYLPQAKINFSWEFSDVFYYYAVPINSLILDDNVVTLKIKPSQINDLVLLKWSNDLAGKQWQINNQGVTTPADSEDSLGVNPDLLEAKLNITGAIAQNAKDDSWWLAIPQPQEYFQDVFLSYLAGANIAFNDSKIIDYQEYKSSLENSPKELFFAVQSPNLSELIKTVNQNSDNLYAEVLFKYLDANNQFSNSQETITKVLFNLGIKDGEYKIKDGSGLSRQNLIKPLTFVTLLQQINQSEYREVYRDSLTIAGVQGTLKRRFQDTDLENKVWGKTGTLTGVSALSGYLFLDNFDDLAFSIIVNNSTASNKALRNTIDSIVISMNKLEKCHL